jgi:hypothetical protein
MPFVGLARAAARCPEQPGGTGNLDATVSGVSQHFLAALRAKEFEFAH